MPHWSMACAPDTKFCAGCEKDKNIEADFGRTYDKGTGKYYVRHRCKACLNQEQKDYAAKLGPEYRRQRKVIKEKRREENPVLFHVQERISQWRKADASSDLTTSYLVHLWHEQKGLCYFTGVPLAFSPASYPTPTTASLDKLNPTLGYKQGNVVWSSYQANTSKGHRSEAEFYAFCRLVLDRAGGRIMG